MKRKREWRHSLFLYKPHEQPSALFQADLFSFRKQEYRYLSILEAELFGGFERIFGKNARTVEIIQAVGGIKPAANDPVVHHGMANDISEFFSRMASLGGLIRNNDALGGYRHSAEV